MRVAIRANLGGMDELIYKICSRAAWQAAERAQAYRGSPDDMRDGFIHFSSRSQVAGTAAKYFAGQTDLVVVAVATSALGANLRYEPSRGGELFPHLYGDLPTSAARWVADLGWDGQRHVMPF
jgi:uncharacterized protein (DUF952 family)